MKSVLLDTSILVLLNTKKNSDKVAAFIKEHLIDSELYASEITCYEYYRSAQNRKNLLNKIKLLDSICKCRFSLDEGVIRDATFYWNALYQLKKTSEIKIQAYHMSQFSDADILIGATALKFNTMVCTTNRKDYPSPIFDEIIVEPLPNGDKIYVLQPDVEYYKKHLKKFS